VVEGFLLALRVKGVRVALDCNKIVEIRLVKRFAILHHLRVYRCHDLSRVLQRARHPGLRDEMVSRLGRAEDFSLAQVPLALLQLLHLRLLQSVFLRE